MKNITDYYLIDRKIDKKNGKVDPFSKDANLVRVAVLGSFTQNGIKEVLNVKCGETGLILRSYVGEYHQYNQDILDENSAFYKFKPHLTLLLIDARDILREHYDFPYRLTSGDRKNIAQEKLDGISHLIDTFTKNCSGKLLMHNFCVPGYSPMGILENKQEFGFFEMIRHMNMLLARKYKDSPQVYIFDYDGFASGYGKNAVCDDKMRYIADMKIDQNAIPSLCCEYMRYIKALKAKTRKCVVCDLDNTLWGGIVGEDGFDGISLGPTAPGNAFVEFQKHLLNLFDRGIILAVNSNNNAQDALKVIREHPYMVLKENNFASIKINWENKASNLAAIAKDINIGLDSLVYLDDDKRNRQLVREMLPQVYVPELPEDPALYVGMLKGMTDLDTLQITEEDRRRGSMYAAERQRKEAVTKFTDIKGFLKHLEIKVSIDKADNFSIPRISQLTQKTNQFNFTTRRYTEEDVRSMASKKNFHIYCIDVKDRFGDNGIAGVVILKKAGEDMVIDSFLLSCRVLGKEIEKAVAAFCFSLARKSKAKRLVCEFVKTEKNAIAKKFLEGSPFKFKDTEKGVELWRAEAGEAFKAPEFIKVTVK